MRRIKTSTSILVQAAFALVALTAVSCGATVDLAIGAGGSAAIGLGVEVPPAVEFRIRRSSASAGAAASAPLFDASAVSRAVAARGATVDSSRTPTTGSYRGSYRTGDLAGLIAGSEGLGAAIRYVITSYSIHYTKLYEYPCRGNDDRRRQHQARTCNRWIGTARKVSRGHADRS